MVPINDIARQLIVILQNYIKFHGFTPVIHFELEGCYQLKSSRTEGVDLNYSLVNKSLKQLNINGELIAEYWSNQWEYVSNNKSFGR